MRPTLLRAPRLRGACVVGGQPSIALTFAAFRARYSSFVGRSSRNLMEKSCNPEKDAGRSLAKGALRYIARHFSKKETAYIGTTSDLPPLPPAPRYPCPFLTKEEIKTYVEPLAVRGWELRAFNLPSEYYKPGQRLPSKHLAKVFRVPNQRINEKLMEVMNEVSEDEDHAGEYWPFSAEVTIGFHTHTALRPAAYPEEPRRERIVPGVSLRDVRVAYLMEQRLQERGEQEAIHRDGEELQS